MKTLLIIFIFRYLTIIFASSHKSEIKMLVDLVKSYDNPTAVTAFLCWKTPEKLKTVSSLGSLNYPTTIKFINTWNTFQQPMPQDTIIVTELTCPGADDFLEQVNKTNMFSSPYRWLIIGNGINSSDVIVPFSFKRKQLYVSLNSEVLVATKQGKEYYKLHLIYKLRFGADWITEYFANWTNSSGLQKSHVIASTTRLIRRRNLAGEQLAVIYNVNDKESGPYSNNRDHSIRKSEFSVTHWGYLLMLPMFDFLNATRLNYFSDGWGYHVNGSWNGLVGGLARGTAELSGTAIFMNKDRLPYVDYLTNPVQTAVKFVFREPPLSYQNNLFLLPFNKAVWYSLSGFVLIMMFVIYIHAKWETKKFMILDNKSKKEMHDAKLNMSLSDVAMMIVGAISQQGTSTQLRGPIGRLVTFILFLAFLFLFTAYSASIVALLQSSSKQIRTLSDLLNSKLELGVENTSYNIHYFTTAKDPIRKAIYETKVAPQGSKPNFMSVEAGVRKLQKHPFAFNMDIGVGYRLVEKYFYEHEKCGLQEIAYIPVSKPWMVCRKASPYAELFKIGMYRIREHGMGARANNIVYSKKPACSISGGKFDSVSIVDIYPPLLMLLYGMLLACAILFIEILIHRKFVKKAATGFDGTYTYDERLE